MTHSAGSRDNLKVFKRTVERDQNTELIANEEGLLNLDSKQEEKSDARVCKKELKQKTGSITHESHLAVIITTR